MWDDDDHEYFEGFTDAMFWFFDGPWWAYVLVLLFVAGLLWIF